MRLYEHDRQAGGALGLALVVNGALLKILIKTETALGLAGQSALVKMNENIGGYSHETI